MPKKGKKKAAAKQLGIKLPKELRQSAGALVELAQSPLAREVATAALLAAASVLATRKGKEHQPGHDDETKPGLDIGGLVSHGIAAFVAGLKQPTPPTPGKADTPEPRPKPKLVP
jgi:hypothetical protein